MSHIATAPQWRALHKCLQIYVCKDKLKFENRRPHSQILAKFSVYRTKFTFNRALLTL